MRVACVRNAYTIERLRNLWTRTVGACAHAQFPVILECPLINAADVENTRTWIYRRDDDGRWLETVQESGEVRGGREGRRGSGKTSNENSPYFVTPRLDRSRIKYQSHARFDTRGYDRCTLLARLILASKNLRNANRLIRSFSIFSSI